MQADNIASLIEFVGTVNGGHFRRCHSLIGAVSVVSIYLHAKALCNTGNVTAHITKGVDTQFLAFQFGSAGSVVEITNGKHHETECQFRNSVGVLARCIHSHYIVSGSRSEVDVIETCASANDNAQFLGRIEHFSIHNIGADDDSFCVSHCVEQLLFACIFLQEHQLIASFLHHFADAVYGNLCEGLFGSN